MMVLNAGLEEAGEDDHERVAVLERLNNQGERERGIGQVGAGGFCSGTQLPPCQCLPRR